MAATYRPRRGVAPGDILKGRFQIGNLIGKGGMSRVFLATDLTLTNKLWAVKEVDRRATDPTGRPIEQNLANEAKLLSGLDHPSIVRIVDTLKTEDFIYVVMDHVEGEALDKVVRRSGPQSEADVRQWMLQVCDALSYLHHQNPPVIYRDMKPANVMLRPDGFIKLIDFGVSREFRDEARKDTIAFGTQGYAPPEQYGKAQTDARSDIYAIGTTIWHLLAGEAPPMEFPLPDVRTKNPNVSEGFAEVIIPKCCALDREKRYQSCEELAADLEIYEELTREYRGQQARKVHIFAATAISSAVCAALGIGCLVAREAAITQKYESYMQVAARAKDSDVGEAEENYLSAIAQRPGAVAPYEGLIECYKTDGVYDEAEQKQFNDAYRTHLEDLQASDSYAELELKLGKLYWYFYTNEGSDAVGDPDGLQTDRIAASAEHFKIAAEEGSEYRSQAKVYAGIADFTANIRKKMQSDDDDNDMYETFWNNLESLIDQVEGDTTDSKDTIRLDAYVLVTNALETYMNKFERAGVERADVEALYERVSEGLGSLSVLGDLEAEGKQQASTAYARLNSKVLPKIAVVYSGAGVGLD